MGRRVRGSTTGRPIMALLGRRWALRVVWELRDDPLTFGALRQACGDISTSVLAHRLGELTAARIVDRGADGSHALSAAGRSLLERLAPLEQWARAWAARQRA
jgi:DNA-binding HxlR family transcriptional regulator